MINDNLAGYYFHQGTNYSTYLYMGCNATENNNVITYSFRTWAPSASDVFLRIDKLGWDTPIKMNRITENGVYEILIEPQYSLEGAVYKYEIHSKNGVHLKGDPYARYSKGLADGGSIVFTNNDFKWTDGHWLNHRKRAVSDISGYYLSTPINIYEVHFGSFIRKEDNSYYSYRETADILVPYLKYMGYTHVELLPLAEHPYDGSWGYQVCGFYAPTSRFGTPDDFKYFINKMHKNGIGVIMDWVPAHFPKDEWGLFEFDGGPLYEYQGNDRMESRSWGTRFFDLGREEIQSFLVSNALYFLREFRIDGLRVDAVASMLYLDYDRDAGEWIPNKDGTNLNLEAIAFFKKLNSAIFAEFSDVLMIAEESTSYGLITHPVSEGGLGFNMKWNMGWANDFYDYISSDPVYRKYMHKALNFPLMYAFTENYCLPISHDEVVHGKRSFVDKMYGDYDDKFLQARASMLLMMTYPGKKLTFMGTEYAQFREWDYENSLEWFMLDYPKHKQFSDYVRALNAFYLTHTELWEIDFDQNGFKWLLADEADKNCVAYRRIDSEGKSIIILINFSGANQTLRFEIGNTKRLNILFESTSGAVINEPGVIKDGNRVEGVVTLSKFSGVILREANKKIKFN